MDKKNTTIGVILLILAIASMIISARYAPKPPPPAPIDTTAPAPNPGRTMPTETVLSAPGSGTVSAPVAGAPAAAAKAEYAILENDFVTVRLTNLGGALDQVALKKHAAVKGRPEPYVLDHSAAAPAFAFVGYPGLDHAVAYQLIEHSPTKVVYRAEIPGQLQVTRTFTLASAAGGDSYVVRHETTFKNLTDQPLPLPRASVSLGTAAPIGLEDVGLYLNVGYYDGDKSHFIKRGDLEGGGFLSGFGIGSKTDLPFIDKPAAVKWAVVKNQFFASVLSPDEAGTGVRVERVKLDPLLPATDRRAYGVTGTLQLDLKPLAPHATATWGAGYYSGPKEYRRLANTDRFKHNEDLVMEFGFFGWFAKLLLWIMTTFHRWIGGDNFAWGWGWAIVITTLFLKIATLPLTLSASRSGKRMQKLMPHMNALREKFKDNPAKLQEGMMKLYKDNKVNPLGSCLPVLVTIPFFIGFFSMLQTTSELRFASFLWASDLSAPDTIARILGFPLNIMPLLMGATMIVQMRITPVMTTDPAQATMMKVMPWIFTLFCYNFSCALALYSTINGLFTIGQQLVVNRMPDPELPVDNGGAAPGGMKNVTPKKKK
jgi:YidC/Oxa1 family membrane protein insertase